MPSQKLKYTGLIAFSLFVIAFVIDLITVIGGFQEASALEGASKTLSLYILFFELGLSLTLIVNSVVGIVKLMKSGDGLAALRRASDGIGALGLFVVFIQGFALYFASEYAKANHLSFEAPASTIAMIVLMVIAIIFSILGSIKKLAIATSKKCIFLIIGSILSDIVMIITIAQAGNAPIVIVEYILLIVALLAFTCFGFFGFEEYRNQ